MDYKELFLQAITSLRKNVLRTALTMLGIIIGISAVILIVSIGQGAVKFITAELSAFGTNFFSINPGSSAIAAIAGGQKNLTLEDAEAIEKNKSLTNVKTVIPFTTTSIKVSANGIDKSILVYGSTEKMAEMMNPTMLSGEFLSEDDISVASKVVVLGTDVSKDFFGESTNPVGERIRIDNKPFRIIGVARASSALLEGSLNDTLFIPTTAVISQILGQDASLRQIGIKVKDPDLINQTIEDVKVVLRDRHDIGEGEEDDFTVQSFRDILTTVQTIISLLTLMVAAISGISLVVGGVGVMNIMLVTVTERTREIGLLKAIGAKQKDILTQFLMEAVVVTITGGAIGILLGIGGAFLISLFVPIPFVISLPSIAVAVGVSAFVGIVFGLYPARKASRMSPIDALRYE